MFYIKWTLCQICLFEFIRVQGGVKFMKDVKWGTSFKSLGTFALDSKVPAYICGELETKNLVSVSRPALGPTQPPGQWDTGSPSPGAKARPERKADHSRHLVPRSRMSRSYTSPPTRIHGM
jgi:hypothetical protein